MEDAFLPIRHYNEREARFAWKYLIENEDFRKALKLIEHKVSLEQIEGEFANFKSTYDFQLSVAKRFIETFVEKTVSVLDMRGLENLQPDVPYLFIANHRDIVMDTALLQYYFMANGRPTSKIAFGNNLISMPLLDAFSKLNKMFIVKRDGTIREKLASSKLLSEYIHYSLTVENDSVWTAQRNGRTKDGIDKTQPGLLKMLTEWSSEEPVSLLMKMNIVPVTISYEYEPCDKQKARELALSENAPYVKQPGEDFMSMQQGIFGYKGKITLVIGKPLTGQLDLIDDTMKVNDKLAEVAHLIDKQIYADYQLYSTNYIAFDMLENCCNFSDKYDGKQRADFEEYLKKQAAVPDVAEEKMMDYLLRIYANPVKSSLGLTY
ncbi:MAG: 1-acyl-sn-glycerol-3-phosphate acyltransferase [Bacteroidales bacterium]|nr:1-acyl-sn-glycerol-3-phosphate acyltransferase [Bacteroidales bacterium]